MNVVHTGAVYQIFGDGMETYNHLPAKVYDVNFSKMQGFFLTSHHDLEVTEDKIYGAYQRKIDKILNGFAISSRNFGVILSGPKGVGKSLFAKLLSIKAKQKDLPVLIVSGYTPGVADFISSIEQEVVVLFDEFEKTFSNNDKIQPQDEMLSLFDGLDCGKKLFVITCNEIGKLSSYLLNRPGRFHYHFALDVPTPDEIREYLMDKLDTSRQEDVEKVVNFSAAGKITYDCLRAIAFELNQGYSLEETIQDLNITRDEVGRFEVIVEFMDGTKVECFGVVIDICSNEVFGHWYRQYINNKSMDYYISFKPNDLRATRDGNLVLDKDKVIDHYLDETDLDEFSDDMTCVLRDRISSIKKITCKKTSAANNKYVV